MSGLRLQTRVARRMVGLFLLCALLPIIALAVVSYRHVSSQLYQQSAEQLRTGSKELGMAIIERLQMADAELTAAAHSVADEPTRTSARDSIYTRITRLDVRRDAPGLTARQRTHLAQGGTVIVTRPSREAQVWMVRMVHPAQPDSPFLWGEVVLERLWGPVVEDATEALCVLGGRGEILTCPSAAMADVADAVSGKQMGDTTYTMDRETWSASSWTAFLGFQWAAPSWTVLVSRSRSSVLAPMEHFSRSFVIVMLLALVLVFLLSNIWIRRRMEPLAQLQEGTRRVAQGNFDEPVQVASGDEFEYLAGSFNTMSLRLGKMVERLDQLSWGTLAALARTIDANSHWTAGHSERVTAISLAIGRQLGLSSRELDIIHRGGLLHDIGKIGIPAAVLDKPAKLTDEEMEIIRSHPAVGSRILAPIPVFQDIIPIVRHHHERLDGTGYPDRLAGKDIPLLARIVAVADVYDALVSDRPYRPGWTTEAAVDLLRKTAGTHHDPEIVDAFLAALNSGAIERQKLPALEGTPLPVRA